MAITFRDATTAWLFAPPGSTQMVTIPAAVQAGDVLLIAALTSLVPNTPTGWTVVLRPVGSDTWGRLTVLYKVAEVGDAGSTVALSFVPGPVPVAVQSALVCVAYGNVNAAAPVDVAAFRVGTSATITAPSIETTSTDELVVCVTAAPINGQIGDVAGTTLRASAVGPNYRVKVQDYPHPSPGPTGAKQAKLPSQSAWIGFQLGLRHGSRAPNAPVLTAPPSGAGRDLENAGETFVATFSDPDVGDSPSAYALRIDTGSGYEYWDEANQALSPTEVKNPSTEQAFTIPPGVLANGQSYAWSVKYWDQDDAEGTYAADFTVVGNTPPVVTVVGPGTVTDTTRPTIKWSHTDVEGDPQFAWNTVIETGTFGTEPGAGTRVASGGGFGLTTEWTPDVDLPNNTSFRAFVRVYAPLFAGQWSDWAFADFSLDLTAPTAPTLTATYEAADNRVELVVTGTHETADFADTTFVVECSDDGGTTWTTVRDAGALPGSGTPGPTPQTVYDYEAPPYAARLYRARTVAVEAGNVLSSDPSATVEVTPAPTNCWIKDPLDPTANLAVELAEFSRARELPATVWSPVGRTRAMVTYGTARGYRGTLTIRSWDKATFDAVWDLLASRRTLLVQTMHAQRYIAVTGDVQEEDVLGPPSAVEPYPTRHSHTLTVPVVEVDVP